MKLRMSSMLVAALVAVLASPGRAAQATDPNALLDKAIQAMGGAEKLGKVKAASWTTKGTLSLQGNDFPVTQRYLVQGLDHVRKVFEGDFGGMTVEGLTVLAGDQGWRKFMGNVEALPPDQLANEKRLTYLEVVPLTILPLKGAGFKLETVADERIGDKPAAGLKVTPADGKEFRLYFDKEAGLPVRLVAKVLDFMGSEVTEETTFSEYRLIDGVRKATRVQSKRNGEKFLEQQISDFKVLDQVEPKSFEQPK